MATDGVLCCSIHVAVVALDAVDVFVDDHYVCSSVAQGFSVGSSTSPATSTASTATAT